MDLIEKYYKKLNDLIEEAKTEGVDIRSYHAYLDNENKTDIEEGIYIMQGDNHKKIPTWKR